MMARRDQSKRFCLLLVSSLFVLFSIIGTNGEYSNNDNQDKSVQLRSLLTSTTTDEAVQFEYSDENGVNNLFDGIDEWDYRDGLPSGLLYDIKEYLWDTEDILNFINVPSLTQMDFHTVSHMLITRNEKIVQTIFNNKTATLVDLINNDDNSDIFKFYAEFLIVPQRQWSSNQKDFWNKLVKIQTKRQTAEYIVLKKESYYYGITNIVYEIICYDISSHLYRVRETIFAIDFTQCGGHLSCENRRNQFTNSTDFCRAKLQP